MVSSYRSVSRAVEVMRPTLWRRPPDDRSRSASGAAGRDGAIAVDEHGLGAARRDVQLVRREGDGARDRRERAARDAVLGAVDDAEPDRVAAGPLIDVARGGGIELTESERRPRATPGRQRCGRAVASS